MTKTATKTTRKKRGRPPLPPTEGKREVLTLRVTAELRQRLEGAASDSGRSMSQEAELRIDRSFSAEDERHASFGGQDRYRLAQWIAFSIQMAEDITGKRFRRDRETTNIAIAAITEMLQKLVPEAAGGLSDDYAAKLGKSLGADLVKLSKRKSEQEKRTSKAPIRK